VTHPLAQSDDLLDALRGTAALRPGVDRGLAGGLRAWLDDGVFERLGVPAPGAVRLSAGDLARAPTSGAAARLRGAMVARLLALRVTGADGDGDAWTDGIAALEASGRDDDQLAALRALDRDEVARLRAEVTAHAAVLASRLPRMPARWSPRCGVRQRVALAGGGVVLRGTVDLALGQPGGSRACVCLLDVTTSPLAAHHELRAAFTALLETLRTGEPPLRVAVLSTDDGRALVRDVDGALLAGAVEAVLAALPATVSA
jgi:hypothetical protein